MAALLPSSSEGQGALNRNPKLSWHWHVHQPIYWNGQNRIDSVDRYEYAWDSIRMKDGGSPHPTNNLRGIFGLDDRIAAYQYRMRDALATIGGHPKSGAVVSYSGALMENVKSLGMANQLGFSPGWKNGLAEANTWTTPSGASRLEFTNFSFHHGLVALLPTEAAYMSIRLQQEIIKREFGQNAVDRGFFPTEMCWSKRLIPVLKDLNIDWTIVSGEHIARACPDFPIEFGQGGIGCDPPNRADQINPNGEQFIRTSIQRGVAPVNANPLSYQPAHQKWVNPATGEEETIVVVPADQGWGWLEGYGQVNAQMLTDLTARNNPNQPSLVLMSHDGDNAYAGGYSYYMENLSNLANDARNRGGEAVTVSQYLADFPPPTSNLIHVEDGGWVNADGDFGSPVYINWNYPLLNAAGEHDPISGWHEKVREMAIFHEVNNRILTAEQMTAGYTRNYAKILDPDGTTHPIDRAWHYYLGSFDSGNVYYGNVEDFSIKGTLGSNKVADLLDSTITANLANDRTPPTIFVPQRHPYNPGALNFGVAYANGQLYQGRRYVNNGDFTIWTFVADVSGPPTAVLRYRIDTDGTNPLTTNQNETYAGGAEVGGWIEVPMNGRQFPNGDALNKPDVNYRLIGASEDLLPRHMPWHFSAEVKNLRSTLIDYYIESVDARGNISRSAIQHVYIGDGSGATGGGTGDPVVSVAPAEPARGETVTVTYNATGRNLASAPQVYMHYGKNGFAGGAVAPDATMTNAGSGLWAYSYTVPTDATSVNFVFNNGSGTWDNNGGGNWNFNTVAGSGTEPTPTPTPEPEANPFVMDGVIDSAACDLGGGFRVAEQNGWVYIATNQAQTNDTFLYVSANPTTPVAVNWAKAGLVGTYQFFLAAESTSGYSSWFNTTAAFANNADFVQTRTGAVLEGAFRKSVVGSTVHVAAGYFGTADGGALIAQSPAAVTANGNLEANEYRVLDGSAVCGEPTPTPTPTSPLIELNKSAINASTAPGTNATANSFTIRNAGGGTLDYTVAVGYGAAAIPSAAQVATYLRSGGSNVGMDLNGDQVIDAADVALAIIGVPAPSWLSVNPNSGNATTETDTISVNFASASLGSGTYTATITVNGNGTNAPRTIPVTLTVAAVQPPAIGLSTTTLNATTLVGTSPAAGTINVSNTGGGTLNWTATLVDIGSGTNWLSIAPNSGDSVGEPDTVTVTYATNALAVGNHRARIDIAGNAGNSPQSVTINLDVTASLPSTTTVSPNPPIAGQSARVWYASTAGPIAGRSQYSLYWGINGGPTGTGTWLNITTTPMTNANQGGMWYADITIPTSATTLNFVTNDGNNTWDNNGGANWNFAVVEPNLGDPAIGLAPTSISLSLPQGSTAENRTVTLSNTGTGTLNFSAAVIQNAPTKGAEPAKATGTRKSIAIDGVNTAGEWTATERVATAPAFDNANVVGGNWSTHETQLDYTGLYAAWDASNLYVAIQISDVIDIEDAANAGSSQGTAPIQMNLPQFVAINTRPGGYGAPTLLSDMWTKKHGFSGTDQPDYQVYFASNFYQGPFVCEYKGGWNPDVDAFGPTGQIYQDNAGLRGASAKSDAGGPIIGPTGKNYRTLSHNTGRESFLELQIPLSLIGNPDLDNSTIGLFVGHGEGFSGVDTIPVDPAATNTPGVSNSNSPNEWEDADIYTVPFAVVGAGTGLGGTATWLDVAPEQGAVAEGANTPLTLSITPTDLEPGVYNGSLTVTGNADNSPQSVPVTLTITGGSTDPVLALSKTSLPVTSTIGSDATAQTFTVRNSGGGSLDYTITEVDTGSGTNWFAVNPASGSSTGESDTVTVTFDTDTLSAGVYTAQLSVGANSANAPLTVGISLTVQAAIPSTTTVVPNPLIAGAGARVWYASSAGPISGRTAYNLHWGTTTGGTPWQNVISTPMVNANQGGMWYADITIPANATALNFVTNDGNNNWDNNGGLDWLFPVAASTEPVIQASAATVSATTTPGSNPANATFTVRNSGAGTLNYTLSKVDTGDGTAFFSINPTSGSSTGEQDTVTVTWNAASLAADTYVAAIQVTGNATNSPAMVTVSLTVGESTPVTSPITIGRGPSLGSNTEGTQYFQEFQDWNASDLRALDLNDVTALNDGFDGSRDLVALYSRFEGNNLYLRVDLLDLAIGAENGNADLYVLIDCATGGVTTLPNGISGSTVDAWDLMIATYDATNFGVARSNNTAITGAHLGAYWNADLDAVELGVTKQALIDAGWNGTSPVKFMVFTGKDFGTQALDTIGFTIGVANTGTTGRAKFATIAHGNQSLNRGDSMRDRIYIPAARTGVGAPSGFRLTLDTHTLFQIPLNVHMSATLITAIHWIDDPDPRWDGDSFLAKVGSIIDGNQAVDPGAKIGGVFSEHIMPFFVGSPNLNSIEVFDDLTESLWGIRGEEMKVMHVPERVINAVASPGRDVFNDIVDSPYTATYLDEVAHIRNWLYPADGWTGIGGEYGIPRQHKIHLINGVYTFQINDNEDQYKFWPQGEGANMNWRLNLLWKALDTDQQQLTLIFDDWEAMAGYSFGSGYNNNALQYNTVMRWVANKPWIEVVTLRDILDRATNTGNAQYSANWVINQGDIGNQPFDTYDYLHHATEDSYANWYNGTALEESFRNAVPVVTGNIGSGTPMPSGKVFGELGTAGTIIHDTWQAVQAAPQNNLRAIAERGYQAMIYETAWHDEDNTNYERTAASNYKAWASPDVTYDRVSGWAFTLHNHLRGVTITTAAANWVNAVKTGSRAAGVTVQALDLDQDGQNEYVLSNERIWMAFEARGGRCVQAYYYDTAIQDGISILGTSPINNPTGQGEEEGTDTASRCSAFKEMNAGVYADAVYTVATAASSITFTSPNGQVIKTISLAAGSNVITANYTNNTGAELFTRMGVSVNNLDLLARGPNFSSSYTSSSFSQVNNTRGSLTINAGTGASINQITGLARFVIPLTEQMEVRLATGSSSFTLTVPN